MAVVSPQTPKQQFVSLLQAILRDVKAMDDGSFESLLAGDLTIGVIPRAAPRPAKPAVACSEEQVTQLKESLEKVTARDQARELIGGVLRTKRDMSYFARFLDIPIPSKASSAEMVNRLVEATVGYRLRSAAIRGSGTKLSKVDYAQSPAAPSG